MEKIMRIMKRKTTVPLEGFLQEYNDNLDEI